MRTYFLFLALFLAASCAHRPDFTTVGALRLTADPHAGELIQWQYKKDSNQISDEKGMLVTLYYTVKDRIYAEPLPASDTEIFLRGTFKLPDSAQSFALKIEPIHRAVDYRNIDRPRLVFPVDGRSGNPVPGALAGMSLFYNDIGFDDLGSSLLDLYPVEDTALALMRADFKAYPEIRHRWMNIYLNTLLKAKGKAAYPEILRALTRLLTADSIREGDYLTAYQLYVDMDMWDKANQMISVGPRVFPDGPMAMQADLSRFSFLGSVDSMIVHYNIFRRRISSIDSQMSTGKMEDKMLGKIALQYRDQGNYRQFMVFESQVTDPLQRATDYWLLARTLLRNNEDISLADSLAKVSLDLIRQSMDNPGKEKHSYQTDRDWREDLQDDYPMYADTYVSVLSKEGKIKEAITYQKRIVDDEAGERSQADERYIRFLLEAKEYKAAQKQLEKFIVNNKTDDKLIGYARQVYIHVNHSEKGYTDYFNKLQKVANVKMDAGLAKQMIDVPAPVFTLPDLEGKRVSLAALKGKVVVLDFWATWCIHCMASFPGMRQAVNDFKEDTDVVFLFVDSWERMRPEERYKQVLGFIRDHHYTFQVLLDKQNSSDSTQYHVINDYHVSGIPTKFVIGPKGNIRFRKVGFFGSSPAEVREITRMISMARG